MTPGLPQLVPDRPDRISIVFCGERVTVNRAWYDHVVSIANGPHRNIKETPNV